MRRLHNSHNVPPDCFGGRSNLISEIALRDCMGQQPTLRFWEKELDGILAPLRTHEGQRRYTVENIAVIEEIKKLKKKGMSLPEIKRKLGKGQMSEAGSQACPPSRATLNILYPFVDSLRRGGRACPPSRATLNILYPFKVTGK